MAGRPLQAGRHDRVKTVTFSADDFGLSEAVNEGIERAHRDGILQAASLMVAAPAAADAVRRARANPSLRVGLHLVVIEGPAALPCADIPDLVDASGQFPSDQLALGLNYFFRPRVRRQLQAEIRAQFAAFAATGLTLDHANAHKHMHLHPTVGAMMLRAGADNGLRRIRVPAEPPQVIARCGTAPTIGDRLLYCWTGLLRRQARAAGIATNDHCFGLAWSGHMTADRIRCLLPNLPDGDSEIYFHPAARRDAVLDRLMPTYEHTAELAALLDRTLPGGAVPNGALPNGALPNGALPNGALLGGALGSERPDLLRR
jgi:hopanoid biosynthesis associated protein HpnK